MGRVACREDRDAGRHSVGGNFGAQVDVFDLAANQCFEVIDGDPHDLAITPNGERLLGRTHTALFLYDLANLPTGNQLGHLSRLSVSSTHTSYGGGLDSVVATEERVVMMARNDESAKIRFFDITADTLDQLHNYQMPERPIDLCFTPSAEKVVCTGWSRVMVFDLRDFTVLLDHDVSAPGAYPGCDGLAELLLDNPNLPGAAISADSTWNFQFVCGDRAGGGSLSNTTGGREIQFGI